MSQAINSPQECCNVCPDPVVTEIPGPQGDPGENGENGTNGVSPFTLTTAQFIMPAVDSTVSVSVEDTSWMFPGTFPIGQYLNVEGAGYMFVASVTNATTVVLRNIGYDENAPSTTVIPSGSSVVPTGPRGEDGTPGTSGAPADATYIVNVPDGDLPNAQPLSALATGIVKSTTGTGIVSIAVDGTDYLSPSTGLVPADVGVSVQGHSDVLDDLGGVAQAANTVPYFNGATSAAVTALTAFARTLLDDATAAAARTTLGFPQYIPGYTTTALTNVNVTLTPGTSKENQRFTGTLSGPVILYLDPTGAVEGEWFYIYLSGVEVSVANTLDIRDTSAGSLKLYNTAVTLDGMIRAVFNGTQWMLFNTEAVVETP